jgi:hypothetical protein
MIIPIKRSYSLDEGEIPKLIPPFDRPRKLVKKNIHIKKKPEQEVL